MSLRQDAYGAYLVPVELTWGEATILRFQLSKLFSNDEPETQVIKNLQKKLERVRNAVEIQEYENENASAIQ